MAYNTRLHKLLTSFCYVYKLEEMRKKCWGLLGVFDIAVLEKVVVQRLSSCEIFVKKCYIFLLITA